MHPVWTSVVCGCGQSDSGAVCEQQELNLLTSDVDINNSRQLFICNALMH